MVSILRFLRLRRFSELIWRRINTPEKRAHGMSLAKGLFNRWRATRRGALRFNIGRFEGCEFFLLSQVRFSRRRRCRTQKCGQLDLSSTRACWLVICQVWLSRVARRQMRAVRVMRLGMRTYRISCMDVTDSICRAGACASLRDRLRRPVLRTTFFGACAAILSPHISNFR